MTPCARIAAAIDILSDIEIQRRPAADVLKEWGVKHRFAGAKDRAAIATLIYDSLRCRASAAHVMGANSARAIVLGALREMRGETAQTIAELCSGEAYAPLPLSIEEQARLAKASLDGAPAHVRGNFPEWLAPAFADIFGDDAVTEGEALATRAPLDLRVNTLKTTREK